MIHVRHCILGAGPSGLAFASALQRAGDSSFIVLEKESAAGGLCRSVECDGRPLDIGGGHFLDVRRKRVLDFLFSFMPREEWVEHQRVAKIRLRGVEVDHPLEGNLWQLPVADQIDFLESIAQAGCVRGEPPPGAFDSWVRWKLGARIAEEYLLPYNRKLWSLPLDMLGTYWLHKLPSVSFRETLRSCLARQSAGSLPAHGTFLYPRSHGFGEVWRRVADSLGPRLVLGTPVRTIDPASQVVNGEIHYDRLVTTIPWAHWPGCCRLPAAVSAAIAALKHVAIDVDYFSANLPSPAHWIYEPDESISHHRLLLRHNFCPGARGHWAETNVARSGPALQFRHRNDYAYPVSTVGKPAALAIVHRWSAQGNILPLGRWGTWEHMNSDVAVDLALDAAHAALHP